MGNKNVIRNCHKATFLATKKEESGLDFKEQIYLWVHLLFCFYCKRFTKQSKHLSKLFHTHSHSTSEHPSHQLSEDFKEKLLKKIEE